MILSQIYYKQIRLPAMSFYMVGLMNEWVIYNEQHSWAVKTILFKILKFIFLVNRPQEPYP